MDLWIIDFYEVSFYWHWLRIFAKIFFTVKKWIYCNKFASVLAFHKLTLNHSNLSLKTLNSKYIILDVPLERLLPQSCLNCIKVLSIFL